MFQMILFIFLILNSFLFFIMNHPLSLGFILMIQTLIISLFTGIYTSMFWFSYSLFLIFMGGMLILFMYMTSLASNEIFKFSFKMKFFLMALIFMSLIMTMFLLIDFKSFFFSNKMINSENSSILHLTSTIEQNFFFLNKLYNFPTNLITILLINYLFLTLIATVKITNIFKGPLRPKNLMN